MASLFSKALVYLGLVDEERIEGEPGDFVEPRPAPAAVPRPAPEPEGRRIEPPPSASRITARPEASVRFGEAGQQMGVRALRPDPHADILVVEEFGDARILADRVRERTPVVLDFRRCHPDLVRRVIDFSSGLIYALDGTMTKVGEKLVLVLPPHATLGDDEKRRLASLGAYELD